MLKFETEVGGKKITLETGKIAKQANGSVVVRCGDTMVLVAVVASKGPREGIDYFPLSVDVEERMYAAGKIPGGFYRREGRPGEASILNARLIDRPLRPNFPSDFRNEIQVVATILSADQENPPDILGIIGASAALSISNIPFNDPVAGVRIGRIDGKWVVNPTFQELENSDMDIIAAGKKGSIAMVEAEAKSVPEADILEAFKIAQEEINKLADLQEEMKNQIGNAKMEYEPFSTPDEVTEDVYSFANDKLKTILKISEKEEREAKISELKKELIDSLAEKHESESQIKEAFKNLQKKEARRMVIEDGERMDGRKPSDIRPITCEVGILPRTHGTGLFTRGQTQVLSILTLGAVGEEQMIDGLGVKTSKRFMHHYNFPPFCTGETGRMIGPKRREIGHGALVERALVYTIPEEEIFPYTTRIVSEVLESNGSSSMASVCGSTLALMDAGVPIKSPIAGIAMGLISENGKSVILTDILGAEDGFGDMDFKVAGTKDGVCALQMDIKIKGLTHELLEEALERARQARLHILGLMLETINEPRKELSQFAPSVMSIKIPAEKIGMVIGPGGKMIRSIIEETGANIDIHEDGTVFISSKDAEGGLKAKEKIEAITKDVEIGGQYLGEVVKTMPFGAFVRILPGKEGLVHISKLAKERVERVEDVVRVGDKVNVKVLEIDNQNRINLVLVS